MSNATVRSLSLIMQTNEEVDQAAALLRAIGLTVTGEDGYVEVEGPSITLSIMRGAMVEVPRHGGLLIQITVPVVAEAAAAARQAGAAITQPADAGEQDGGSAFVQSPTGFTVELLPTATTDSGHR